MIRNLRSLGVAFVAFFAMSALVASAASAAEFHSESSSTTLAGGQTTEHKFTVEAGSTTCTTASFPGSQTGTTAKTVTVSPAYSGCTNSLLGKMKVNMNGCTYTFSASSATAGSVEVGCTGGNVIEVTREEGGNPCTIKVGPQSTGGITYAGMGEKSGRTVTVTANVSTLKYTQVGIFCPGNGFKSEKTFENGTYTGTTEESGKNSEEKATGIFVE